MLINVPQFIDVEDKIVGPLTAKQLGWISLGAVITLVCWTMLDDQAVLLAAFTNLVIFGAMAFYRPNNQSLLTFIMSSVLFVFRPKTYAWRRYSEFYTPEKVIPIKKAEDKRKKKLDLAEIRDVSRALDLDKPTGENHNKFL